LGWRDSFILDLYSDMRIKDWRWALVALLACCLAEMLWSAQTTTVVPIPDPATYHDIQNLSQGLSAKPDITSGAGVPTASPGKIGNIYVNTSNGKVYISTSTQSAGSWAILN
jgi:hypothetical protein